MTNQGNVDQIRQMLHGDEEVIESQLINTSIIALTDKRLLVFSPESEEKRFHSLYLPNVTGISVQRGGEPARAMRAVRTGVYAVLLLGAGIFVDLGNIIDPITAPSGIGISGILSAINSVIVLLGFLDEVLLLFGNGMLLITGWFVLRYYQTRERAVSIAVAGEEPVTVPIASATSVNGAVERLNQAIETTSMGQGA